MDVFDGIRFRKQQEVAARKYEFPEYRLEQCTFFKRPVLSLSRALSMPGANGIIAECKRSSPDFSVFPNRNSLKSLCAAFAKSGAVALAIQTETSASGWQVKDIIRASEHRSCPILQCDFLIDAYQIVEAKAFGADAIVLISGLLPDKQLELLANLAKSIGLEVFLEVQGVEDLTPVCTTADGIIVNNINRSKPGEISLLHSWEIRHHLPSDKIKISKGGICDPQSVVDLRDAGYEGFIVGKHFLQQKNPGAACKKFIQQINDKDNLLHGAIA